MAKIKLRVPTLDGLSKETAALYRQVDGGGFILDYEADGGWGIDDLGALRGKLEEKGRDYERVNTRLQAFKKADGSLYTAEEIQAILAQASKDAELIATLKDKSKTEEQKLQDLVAAAKRPLEAELAKVKGSVDRYRSSTHKAEKKRVVDKILDVLKPKPEWRDLLASEIERQIEVREADDGTMSSVFLDLETGRARMSALSGRDGPMDHVEFAGSADLRKKFGNCLQGDGKKGAGVGDSVDPPQRGGNRTASGADISLPPNYTQKQFEEAFQQSRKQGGQVLFPTEEGATT